MSVHQKSRINRLNSTRSIPLRLATGGVLATLLVGGGYALVEKKDVIVDVNGEQMTLATMSSHVSDALEQAGVEVGAKDLVVPSPDSKLRKNEVITVRSAKPVAVVIDGKSQNIDTTALTVDELVKQLGNVGSSDLLSEDRNTKIPLEGLTLDVTTPKDVALDDGGQRKDVRLAAKTVGDVLKAYGVDVDDDDIVVPAVSEPLTNGLEVKVTHVKTDQIVETKPFEAAPEVIEDPEMNEGDEELVAEGKPGTRQITRVVRSENGVVVADDVINETELVPATPKTVKRGTKPAAPAAPAVPGNTVWDTLAMCESTGNWAINTGNGFSGGLQFTPSTWLAFGGGQYAPMAYMATREQQIDVAQRVQAAQGWGAWPACTAKLGIR